MPEAVADTRVRRELVTMLYDDLPLATCAGALLVPALTWLRWPSGGDVWLVVWAIAQLALHAVAAYLTIAFRRRDSDADSELWLKRANLMHTAVFALWGLVFASFIAPHEPQVTALGVGVSSFVGAFMLTAVFPTPYAGAFNSALLLAPTAARCAWLGGYLFDGLALLIVLNLICAAPRSRRLHEVFVRGLALRLANEDMTTRLASEKERAESALMTRSRFVAAASHDLRQPLHALGLFVELLAAEPLAERSRAFVARIRSASDAVTSLLQSLLDLSCIDAQAVPVERRAFPLQQLFRELAQQAEPAARAKGLQLQVGTTDAWVDSDPIQLTRMLRNLLSNAIRYSDRGTIRLTAQRHDAELEIQVADQGPGIPSEARDKIFEEFYQVPGSRAHARGGLGLGLAIVQGLARLLGHRLHMETRQGTGSGTCFSVFVQPAAAQPACASSPPLAAYDVLAGHSALVIDDQAEVREAMSELLESWQCTVYSAASRSEAIALVQQHGVPDLTICDYHLANGETGADIIAALERMTSPLRALWVTGDTAATGTHKLQAARHPILFKPVTPSKLRAALSALVAADRDTVQRSAS